TPNALDRPSTLAISFPSGIAKSSVLLREVDADRVRSARPGFRCSRAELRLVLAGEVLGRDELGVAVDRLGERRAVLDVGEQGLDGEPAVIAGVEPHR